MSKLDLSTPWQEVRDTIDKETPRAAYWHDKKRGGEEAEQQKRDVIAEQICKDPDRPNTLSPVIDYTSPDGNKWLLYYTGRYIEVKGFAVYPEYEGKYVNVMIGKQTTAGDFVERWIWKTRLEVIE